MQYSEVLLDHFYHPQQVGVLNENSLQVGTGFREHRTSQLALRLQIEVASADFIRIAAFKALGCPALIASSSWFCVWLQGKSLGEAEAFPAEDLIHALQLPAEKHYCAGFIIDLLRDAIVDLRRKMK